MSRTGCASCRLRPHMTVALAHAQQNFCNLHSGSARRSWWLLCTQDARGTLTIVCTVALALQDKQIMHKPVRNVHGLRCSCASRTVSQQVLLPAAEKTTTGFIHGCNGPTLAFLQPPYLPRCSCIQSCALGGFVLSLCAPNGVVVCCLGQLTAVSLHSKNTQMIVHFRNIRCMQAAHACPVLIHAANHWMACWAAVKQTH